MITPVLIAALLVTVPVAPARGDSAVPLVHVVGWNRVVTAGQAPSDWEYDRAEHDVAFTVATGEAAEVRWGGSCTIGGVTHRSTLLRHAVCHGSGAYR